MLRFSDVGILWKILTVVGLLAAATVAGTVFSTHGMRFIDDRYGDLLDGYGRANLAMARANRNLVYVDRSLYRLLAESSEDKKKDASQEALDSVGFFQKQIKSATKALPSDASEIGESGKRLGAIMTQDCADVLTLGASVKPGDSAAATAKMQAACDPALNKAMIDISALTNKLLKASDAASDATLEVTNSTIRETYEFVAAALALILAGAIYLAIAGITKPIRAIAGTLDMMSRGEMDRDIPGAERRDEVGMIARAALQFRDQSRETLRVRQSAAEAAQREAARAEQDSLEKTRAAAELTSVVERLGAGLRNLADGDLSTKLEGEFAGAYAKLRDDFNLALDKLSEAIASVSQSARIVESGSQHLLSASSELASRAERQAGTLQESSAAMRDLAEAVTQTAEASTTTKDIISAAQIEATDSIIVVRKTEEAIERIKGSSQKIGAIISVIDEIAFQTNLLALNAGVEAARAGEAGRGFAVVASEVRALAQRSADAAKEIKGLISQSTNEVATGVDLVKATGATFDRIKTQVTVIDGGIADIAGQAIDQSNKLRQVNMALMEIDQATQQNAAMAEETTAACSSLSQQCAELSELVGKFRLPGSDARALIPPATPATPAPARRSRGRQLSAA